MGGPSVPVTLCLPQIQRNALSQQETTPAVAFTADKCLQQSKCNWPVRWIMQNEIAKESRHSLEASNFSQKASISISGFEPGSSLLNNLKIIF